MTEYERGFEDGFAAALSRMERGPTGATIAGGKKISIGFRQDQFDFIQGRARACGCSFAASVRGIIDAMLASRRAA